MLEQSHQTRRPERSIDLNSNCFTVKVVDEIKLGNRAPCYALLRLAWQVMSQFAIHSKDTLVIPGRASEF